MNNCEHSDEMSMSTSVNNKSVLDLPDLFLISIFQTFDLKTRLKMAK